MATLLTVANRALVRLGAKQIGSLTEASDSAIACNIEADECRKETLRAYPWNFARKRTRLNTFPAGTLVVPSDALTVDASATFTNASGPFVVGRDEGFLIKASTGVARIDSVTDTQTVVATIETAFAAAGVLAAESWWLAPSWEWAYRFPKPSDYVRLVKVQRVAGTVVSPATLVWSYWRDMGSEPEPIKVEGDFLVAEVGPKLDIAYTRDETDLDKWDALALSALAAKLAFRVCYAVTGSLQSAKTHHDAFLEILSEARTMDGQEGSIDQSSSDVLLTVRR